MKRHTKEERIEIVRVLIGKLAALEKAEEVNLDEIRNIAVQLSWYASTAKVNGR